MLPLEHLDRIHFAFDDHRLVANAGLLLPASLALRLGFGELVGRSRPYCERFNTPSRCRVSAGLAWIACREPPAHWSRLTLLTNCRYGVQGGRPYLLTIFAGLGYPLRKLSGAVCSPWIGRSPPARQRAARLSPPLSNWKRPNRSP